eukprot:Awhi_evm1s12154
MFASTDVKAKTSNKQYSQPNIKQHHEAFIHKNNNSKSKITKKQPVRLNLPSSANVIDLEDSSSCSSIITEDNIDISNHFHNLSVEEDEEEQYSETEIEEPFTNTLKDYRGIKVIGSSKVAVIHLATHEPTQRLVVLKIQKNTGNNMKEFMKEAVVMEKLEHKGVAKLYTAFIENDNLVMVMEYMSRGDLFEEVKGEVGWENKSEVKRIFVEICEAVRYIHSRGVAHRDIKPENITLTEERHVKLIDFGLSADLKRASENNMINLCADGVGTVPYMSPEFIAEHYKRKVHKLSIDIAAVKIEISEIQQNSKSNALEQKGKLLNLETDLIKYKGLLKSFNCETMSNTIIDLKKVDIWALGVVYFTLITGRFPWTQAVSKRSFEFSIYTKSVAGDLGSEEDKLNTMHPWDKLDSKDLEFVKLMLNPNADQRLDIDEVLDHIKNNM